MGNRGGRGDFVEAHDVGVLGEGEGGRYAESALHGP